MWLKKSNRIFDTSKFAKETDLANLKSEVDKLDIDKLKNVPIALSRLKSNVDKLDNNLGKTILLKRLNMINWLKTLIKTTDTSYLVKKNWLLHKTW